MAEPFILWSVCFSKCNFTSNIYYDQTKLRSHLLACIEINDLKPFPIYQRCVRWYHTKYAQLQRCVSSKHQFHSYATNSSNHQQHLFSHMSHHCHLFIGSSSFVTVEAITMLDFSLAKQKCRGVYFHKRVPIFIINMDTRVYIFL